MTTLRTRALTRTGNPATSFEAADRVTPYLSKQQTQVLNHLRETIFGTDSKTLSSETGIAYTSVSARISELREAGLVEETGIRTPDGRSMIWRAVA